MILYRAVNVQGLSLFEKRLRQRKEKSYEEWEYWGKPVQGFGDINSKLLILGLAPAAHGGNRTGRVFTGDKSADFYLNVYLKPGYQIIKNRCQRMTILFLKDL